MKEAQYNIKIIYPDHENVDDHFDPAGQLQAVNTNLGNFVPNANPTIVKNILYNDLGERTSIEYGNGTITNYKYDARRRMDQLKHSFTGFQAERNYKYDALSNILGITTANATSPALGQLGGPVNHEYEYDTYNRLIYATGNYVGPDDAAPNMLKQAYSLDMEYDDAHNILEKHQVHRFGSVATLGENLPQNAAHAPLTSYKLEYGDYATGQHTAASQSYVQPHAPRTIIEYPNENFNGDPEDPRIRHKMIDYDSNGNQLEIRERITDPAEPQGFREVPLKKHLWDEEDRLRAVDLSPENDEDKPLVAVYTYDASGERSIKYVPGRLDARYSAKEVGKADRLESMLYPNPLLSSKTLPIPENMHNKKDPKLLNYTKHYYIGSERINSVFGSKLGLGAYPGLSETTVPLNLVEDIVDAAGTAVQGAVAHFGKTIILPQPFRFSSGLYNGSDLQDPENYAAFWYHPDHLGSSSYITNLQGEITQHMEYLPFGETLVEEHLNSNNSPYKFNAKEMDAETGNYYYGARYYSPKYNLMLSVDPLYEMFPGWSPYNYVYNNPLNYTDSTGMCPDGDCPEEVYGGELDEVVITAPTKDRTWTSEVQAYNRTPEQYQKDYPEFAGMSDGEMVDYHEKNYGQEYRDWDRKVQGEYRLSQFLNRFKLGFLDNGFADVMVVGGASVAARSYFSSLSGVKGSVFKGGIASSSSSIQSLGSNPFAGKSFQQIENMFQIKGFAGKGPSPLMGKGSYLNPKSGFKYYFDQGGMYKKGFEGPHIDIHYNGHPTFEKVRYFLDGSPKTYKGL